MNQQATDNGNTAPSKTHTPLEGKWVTVEGTVAGVRQGVARLRSQQWEFSGNTVIMREGAVALGTTFVLKPNAHPARLEVGAGPNEPPARFVYQLTNGRLILCATRSGNEFPRDFTSTRQNGQQRFVLKRVR